MCLAWPDSVVGLGTVDAESCAWCGAERRWSLRVVLLRRRFGLPDAVLKGGPL